MDSDNMDVSGQSEIPQSSKLDEKQVCNSAGGFVYKVNDMNRLRRFLCLGSEGGSYYISEKALGLENAMTIQKMINDGKGASVVDEVVNFSVEGRAAKQNQILFALAMCARQEKDKKVKRLAYESLPKVCRIPTHLFSFIEYSEKLSKGTGWGRAHRRAIGNWYLQHRDQPLKLAMHVTKYKNRNGWSHKDVLRLAHPKPDSDGVAAVVKYIIKGIDVAKDNFIKPDVDPSMEKMFAFLQATEDIKKKKDADEIVTMIQEYGLVREHIPTDMLKNKQVWQALLEKMPMTAMIRNLGKMSSIQLLAEGSDEAELVCQKLSNTDSLKAARIHPFNVLVALHTYKKGRGDKGKLKWMPNPKIVTALDSAFYQSFKFVEATGLRFLLALDVSGSMSWGEVNGSSAVNPREASAALSMVTARTENICDFVGFSTGIVPIPINKSMDLTTVISTVERVPMGGTDCAQPMLWAMEKGKMYDVFIVFTDCETWAGKIHPAEALRKYRAKSGIWNAKLIVCAMTSNGFTLADPEDPGMLDMAGFDSNGPEIMRNFVLGLI